MNNFHLVLSGFQDLVSGFIRDTAERDQVEDELVRGISLGIVATSVVRDWARQTAR